MIFGVSQSKTRTLPYKTWGSGGYHFVSIAHSISSFVSYHFELQCIMKSFLNHIIAMKLTLDFKFIGFD